MTNKPSKTKANVLEQDLVSVLLSPPTSANGILLFYYCVTQIESASLELIGALEITRSDALLLQRRNLSPRKEQGLAPTYLSKPEPDVNLTFPAKGSKSEAPTSSPGNPRGKPLFSFPGTSPTSPTPSDPQQDPCCPLPVHTIPVPQVAAA